MKVKPRIVGVDYGEKRIGLAISDPFGTTAQPIGFIYTKGDVAHELQQIMAPYDVTVIVIGLPKNQRGELGPAAMKVQEFGTMLAAKLEREVIYWDERYSTAAVTRTLIQSGMRRDKRKETVDSQAACFILQGYLDSINRGHRVGEIGDLDRPTGNGVSGGDRDVPDIG